MDLTSRARAFDPSFGEVSAPLSADPSATPFTSDPLKHMRETFQAVTTLDASAGQYAEAAGLVVGVAAIGLIAKKALPAITDALKGGSKISAHDAAAFEPETSKSLDAGRLLLAQSRASAELGDAAAAEAHFVNGTKEYGTHSVMKHYPGVSEEKAGEIVESLKAYPASEKDALRVDFWDEHQEKIIRVSSRLSNTVDPAERAADLHYRSRLYSRFGRDSEALRDITEAVDLYKGTGAEPSWVYSNRAALHQRLGNMTEANSDFTEAGKIYARSFAREQGVAAADVEKFVESNLAFPSIPERSVYEGTDKAQRFVIRQSMELDRTTDPLAKARILAARASQYLRLGQIDAAASDIDWSERLAAKLLAH